jgi:peptidoglycan/xylan/chitin deacetylase (PgdA/CDA1 family)
MAAQVIKQAVFFAIRWSGLPWLLRTTYARNKISILVYHDPEPKVIERHLRYLSKRYVFTTMDAVAEAARGGDWGAIPPKALVVTLDDGYARNVALLDVFTKYGVVPTIFACTQVVATRRRYWWTACADPDPLKHVPNAERLRALQAESGFVQTDEDETVDAKALSAEQIRSMGRQVDFGSHTRFHPVLPMCTFAEARDEIMLSKLDLEQLTEKPCRHFSYPNGDFSRREIELLKAAGFETARTTIPGWNRRTGDLFALRVIGSPDDASVNHLAASVLTFFVKRLVSKHEGRFQDEPVPDATTGEPLTETAAGPPAETAVEPAAEPQLEPAAADRVPG